MKLCPIQECAPPPPPPLPPPTTTTSHHPTHCRHHQRRPARRAAGAQGPRVPPLRHRGPAAARGLGPLPGRRRRRGLAGLQPPVRVNTHGRATCPGGWWGLGAASAPPPGRAPTTQCPLTRVIATWHAGGPAAGGHQGQPRNVGRAGRPCQRQNVRSSVGHARLPRSTRNVVRATRNGHLAERGNNGHLAERPTR